MIFTFKTQLNNKINCIDLTVNLINNKFNIYKKPTQTDFIIPYGSNQPFTSKITFLNSLFVELEISF